MWYVILACVLFAPLVEFIFTALCDKINEKSKWHPFANKYARSLKNSNPDCFTMLIKPDLKPTILIGIIGFLFMWLAGVSVVSVAYALHEMKLLDYILVMLIFSALNIPFVSVFLHYFTKKIFFADDSFFIKSLFLKKKIIFSDINYVNEELCKTHRSFTSPNVDIMIIYLRKSKIKITKNYGNYDLARKKFESLNLLQNSF